jgi:hypothetical protein
MDDGFNLIVYELFTLQRKFGRLKKLIIPLINEALRHFRFATLQHHKGSM